MDDEKIEIHEMLKKRDASPVAELREKHKIEIEDKKYEDTWQSCCFQLDRRAVRFFSQFAIAILIIAFCIIQLIRNDTCESQQLYSGILMTIIGIMLPTPSLH
jgi:hypothetical protein